MVNCRKAIKRQSMKWTILFLGAILFTGCASVPMASLDQDREAKMFRPRPGQSMLYVVRPGTFGGGAQLAPVLVEGRRIGGLPGGSYLAIELPPGLYRVSTESPEHYKVISVILNRDASTFVEISWGLGWNNVQWGISQVSTSTGQAAVLSSSRVILY
jgi:hypothetical protein